MMEAEFKFLPHCSDFIFKEISGACFFKVPKHENFTLLDFHDFFTKQTPWDCDQGDMTQKNYLQWAGLVESCLSWHAHAKHTHTNGTCILSIPIPVVRVCLAYAYK